MSTGQWQTALSSALDYLSMDEKLVEINREDGAMQATLRAFSSLRKAAAKEKISLGQEEGRLEMVVQAMQCFASCYQVDLGCILGFRAPSKAEPLWIQGLS